MTVQKTEAGGTNVLKPDKSLLPAVFPPVLSSPNPAQALWVPPVSALRSPHQAAVTAFKMGAPNRTGKGPNIKAMTGALSAKPGDPEGTRVKGHAEESLVLGLTGLGRRFTFEKQQHVAQGHPGSSSSPLRPSQSTWIAEDKGDLGWSRNCSLSTNLVELCHRSFLSYL